MFLVPLVVAETSPILFIEQESPTSIQARWVLPTDVNSREYGYRLNYIGGSNGSVDIEGRYTNNHIITGLKNGANYTMFIVTIVTSDSVTLPSSPVESNLLPLGMLLHNWSQSLQCKYRHPFEPLKVYTCILGHHIKQL